MSRCGCPPDIRGHAGGMACLLIPCKCRGGYASVDAGRPLVEKPFPANAVAAHDRVMRRLLALLMLAAMPAAAPAQPEPASPAAVRQFVEQVTVETEGQLARFHGAVCPLSRGLPPDHG